MAQTSKGAHPEPRKTMTPQRVVLLADGEHGPAERVLAEGAELDVHELVARYAAGHAGRWVAAEWEGPRGWTRFLWGRQP